MPPKINLLFVCAKNKWRSPTAEAIYRRDSRFNVRSAGVSNSARKTITENDLKWANLVFAMENKHKKRIVSTFSYLDLPQIIVLDIPDCYQYMERELVTLLRESIEGIINGV